MLNIAEGAGAGPALVPESTCSARRVRRGSLRNPLALAIVALLLAGCASRFPAPIVHRAPSKRPAPAAQSAPPPLVTQPQASTAGSPDSGPVVTPVPGAPAQSRPLAGAPTGSGQPLATPGGAARASAIRTEPSVAKRPYSEELLAQLKKAAPATAPGVQTASAARTASDAQASVAPSAGAPSSRGFVWPASGQVIQGFSGARSTGLAIAGKLGDPVVAAADGRVIFSGRGPRGYGNLVIVKHDSDTLSVYGHNRTLLVKEGASVKRGQRIAELGDTDAQRPQLHFEIRKDSKPVDPADYLPPR